MKYCATCHSAYASDVQSCPTDKCVLSTTTELVPGLIIRRKYEIMEKIGVGGMASVYRARHIAFNETYAMKVVRGWLTEDEDFVRRLRSEAMIARKLNHPNAVHVDDLDELEDGRPFIVMEFVHGKNLREIIHEAGPLRPARALNIARQVASALGAAHALRIVHRDIKPDNIVLIQRDGDEAVKVMDFGIAKMMGGASSSNFETRAGVVLCTPEYASPEQASGKRAEELDGRSDLYSLGIVLYEMLTGTLPFQSDTPIGMLLAQINTSPRLLTEAHPGLEVLLPLLTKALEKDPAKRFQSANEMVQAIDRVEEELSKSSPDNLLSMPLRHAVSPNEEPPLEFASANDLLSEVDEGKTSRLWLGAVLILLLVVIGIGTWWWSRSQRESLGDDALTTRVQQTLSKSAAGSRIRASVSNGVVMLSGEASDEAKLEDVVATVAGLKGVYRVDRHNVRVEPASAASPATPVSTPAPPTTVSAPPKTSTAVPTQAGAAVSNSRSGGVSPTGAEESTRSGNDNASTATQEGSKPSQRIDPRIAELLNRAKSEHDEGLYDDEIRDYDAVLEIDRNNSTARRGKSKAQKAKQADPGSQ